MKQCAGAIVEASTMRRIGARGAAGVAENGGQPGVKPAFRSVSMYDVGARLAGDRGESSHGEDVARRWVAPDRSIVNAERKSAADRRQRIIYMRAAHPAVEKQADLVAARDLFGGKIDHMTKKAAQRGSEDVQYAQSAAFSVWSGVHRQHSRKSQKSTQ